MYSIIHEKLHSSIDELQSFSFRNFRRVFSIDIRRPFINRFLILLLLLLLLLPLIYTTMIIWFLLGYYSFDGTYFMDTILEPLGCRMEIIIFFVSNTFQFTDLMDYVIYRILLILVLSLSPLSFSSNFLFWIDSTQLLRMNFQSFQR